MNHRIKHLSETPHTIFALSSAPGRSGVAVYRLSGNQAGRVLERLTGRAPTTPRIAELCTFRDPATGAAIDTGLAIWFPAPRSFTGQDCVEIQVHGGRAIQQKMLATLSGLDGCRLAEAGEFAMRAFENGKIDLTSAEGLADLIDADTEAQRQQALAQASGALSVTYELWRGELITAMGLVEAAIDFSDEGDVSQSALATAQHQVQRMREQLRRHLADRYRGEILRRGFRIVLAGPVNAGKSTLLNWMADRDAAITSDEPGTTRDVIEVQLDLGGYPVIVTDTAGFRGDAMSAIEREGMRRSRQQIERADLVIWLSPATAKAIRTTAPNVQKADVPEAAWSVLSQIDRVPGTEPGPRSISAKTGAGMAELMRAIKDEVASRIGDIDEPMITQARHRAHIERALEHLKTFAAGSIEQPELLAEDLRQAASELGRITGRVDPEEILGAIFSRFCIGK